MGFPNPTVGAEYVADGVFFVRDHSQNFKLDVLCVHMMSASSSVHRVSLNIILNFSKTMNKYDRNSTIQSKDQLTTAIW